MTGLYGALHRLGSLPLGMGLVMGCLEEEPKVEKARDQRIKVDWRGTSMAKYRKGEIKVAGCRLGRK